MITASTIHQNSFIYELTEWIKFWVNPVFSSNDLHTREVQCLITRTYWRKPKKLRACKFNLTFKVSSTSASPTKCYQVKVTNDWFPTIFHMVKYSISFKKYFTCLWLNRCTNDISDLNTIFSSHQLCVHKFLHSQLFWQ